MRMALGLFFAIPAIWLPVSYFLSLAGEPIHWQDFMVLAIPALLLPIAVLLFACRPPLAVDHASAAEVKAVQAERRVQFVRSSAQLMFLGGLGDVVVYASSGVFFLRAVAGLLVIAIALVLYFWSNRH